LKSLAGAKHSSLFVRVFAKVCEDGKRRKSGQAKWTKNKVFEKEEKSKG
jgi:hypothetical protein